MDFLYEITNTLLAGQVLGCLAGLYVSILS
jgi:hypothetical protein